MLIELLGLLLGSPGGLLEVCRRPSSKKKMRQRIFKLTLCQEVGRPHRKCFCKQGASNSCTAGTLYLDIAIPISIISQSALSGRLAEVFSCGYSLIQLLQQLPALDSSLCSFSGFIQLLSSCRPAVTCCVMAPSRESLPVVLLPGVSFTQFSSEFSLSTAGLCSHTTKVFLALFSGT